jgi:hypothetical protein
LGHGLCRQDRLRRHDFGRRVFQRLLHRHCRVEIFLLDLAAIVECLCLRLRWCATPTPAKCRPLDHCKPALGRGELRALAVRHAVHRERRLVRRLAHVAPA